MIHPIYERAEPAAQSGRIDAQRRDIAQPAEANIARSSFADLFQHATAASAAGPAAASPVDPQASKMPVPLYEDVRVFGSNGSESSSNPLEFATKGTADRMAAKLGGHVENAVFAGDFSRTAAERLIVGAGANPVNAGLVADLFQKYGDAPGSEAWRVINRDLGRPEMSTTPITTT